MKADLHFYGLIGFQDHWRKVQGYDDENLALETVRASRSKGVDILALTSMHDAPEGIPQGSIHDRFAQFQTELKKDPLYNITPLGNNAMAVRIRSINSIGAHTLYLVNAQKVITKDTHHYNDPTNIVVVGSNRFRNFLPTEELLAQAREEGCITLTTNDVGPVTISDYKDGLTAAAHVGRDLIFRKTNRVNKATALDFKLPWIAVSGAKLPNNMGSAYTELAGDFPGTTERQLMDWMNERITNHGYKNREGHERLFDFVKSELQFRWFTRPAVREKYGV